MSASTAKDLIRHTMKKLKSANIEPSKKKEYAARLKKHVADCKRMETMEKELKATFIDITSDLSVINKGIVKYSIQSQ